MDCLAFKAEKSMLTLMLEKIAAVIFKNQNNIFIHALERIWQVPSLLLGPILHMRNRPQKIHISRITV